MAQSAAERSREYRRRQRERRGTAGRTLVGRGNVSAVKHNGYGRDLDAAALARLESAELPGYLSLPQFRDSLDIAFRRVEQAQRIGAWVGTLSEAEATTPAKAGSSSPAEISRQHDATAMAALAALGLTPASAAKIAKRLEPKLDLAVLAAMHLQDEGEKAG